MNQSNVPFASGQLTWGHTSSIIGGGDPKYLFGF